MSRPELVHVGQTLYWTIRIVDASGQPAAPTSIAVTARINNGAASSAGVTLANTSTGVYDVSYTGTLLEGQTLNVTETVVRNSKTFVNGWQASVVAMERGSDPSALPPAAGSMSELAAAPTSVSADGMSVTMPGIMDRIEADAYDKGNAAQKKKNRGILFSRFTPGDAVGPRTGR